jgi:hypothetical protein
VPDELANDSEVPIHQGQSVDPGVDPAVVRGKAVKLTSGDLPGCFGALPGLDDSQGSWIAGQKSAEGVVPGRAGHWPLDTARPERNGAGK